MRRLSIAGIATLAIASAALAGWPPDRAAADGLTGAFRNFAIETISRSCAATGEADPVVSEMPQGAIRRLCRCVAARVADRATRAQIEAGQSPEMLAIEAETTKACYDALPEMAKRRTR